MPGATAAFCLTAARDTAAAGPGGGPLGTPAGRACIVGVGSLVWESPCSPPQVQITPQRRPGSTRATQGTRHFSLGPRTEGWAVCRGLSVWRLFIHVQPTVARPCQRSSPWPRACIPGALKGLGPSPDCTGVAGVGLSQGPWVGKSATGLKARGASAVWTLCRNLRPAVSRTFVLGVALLRPL